MLKIFAAAEMLPDSAIYTNSRICWRSFRFVMQQVYKRYVESVLLKWPLGPYLTS